MILILQIEAEISRVLWSTMGTKIWLSMHSRNVGSDKIVCTSIHLLLHVSGCEMADLLTRSPRHILSVSNLVLDIHVIFN